MNVLLCNPLELSYFWFLILRNEEREQGREGRKKERQLVQRHELLSLPSIFLSEAPLLFSARPLPQQEATKFSHCRKMNLKFGVGEDCGGSAFLLQSRKRTIGEKKSCGTILGRLLSGKEDTGVEELMGDFPKYSLPLYFLESFCTMTHVTARLKTRELVQVHHVCCNLSQLILN